MTAYFVAPDGYGDETLWRGDGPDDSTAAPVVARFELLPDFLWPLVVGVLTEDAETVDRVAKAIFGQVPGYPSAPLAPLWGALDESTRDDYRKEARAAIAALRGAS